MPFLSDDTRVAVCAACKMASCWQGTFPCVKHKTAGMRELTVAELRKRGREHEDFWVRDGM